VMGALAMSDEESHRMATRARERTLAENTGDHRAKELLHYFEEAVRRGTTWLQVAPSKSTVRGENRTL
jgi:hypothetical protein